MKKILSYITLILLTSTAFAQNFPVQSNVNITPPYSVYLSDYASISSDKLLVTLMLKDVNQSDIQVKLRLTIKGNGIEIRTRADYQPQPLLLQGGAPLLISGTELESYLNPDNLDFSGISKSQFAKNKKLPEGVYQFMAEAVEYRRNVTVSNQGMAVGWLVLNDPPRWTLPMANSLLTATYPQNIFFSWMPMSTASPNSAFTTEYEFTLVELWPDNRAPGDAINSSIPVYQVTTNNTSLVYGPAEPELTPGRKYVCRLRAYDTGKRDLFKNKGYSEILVFTFGQACKPPNTFQHQVLGPEDARVNWTSLPGSTQFILSYAEQNADGTWSNWYHNETLMPTSNIKGLKPQHTYRYQLKAICGTLESEYSEIKQFGTPAPDTAGVECGKDISIPKLDDSPPLATLKVGDIINVGGFEARVIEVEGSGGSFSGKCVVNVKTFGGVRILSEFENISINESHQVTAGVINSVKGELNIIGLDGILDSLDNIGNDDVVDNGNNGDPNVGDPYEAGDSVLVVLGGEEIIITGDTTIITAAGDTIVTDFSQIPPIIMVNGDSTNVTTDKLDFDNPGGGTDGGDLAHASSDTTAYSINYVQFLPFKESDDKVPGFDAYDPGIPPYRGEYDDKKVNNEEYIIPWQSVEANGKPARVNMVIDTKVPDSIQTRLKVEMKGSPLNFLASPDGDTIRILNLVGQSDKDEDLITASYIKDDGDEVPVGYLKLMSYEGQSINVVIVPVDGEFKYQTSALQAFLDKVYAPAFVSWKVDIADQLAVDYDEGEANGLNTSRTLFSAFNKEMKVIIDAMEKRGDYNKKTYYLFVMNKAENESLNGLMPFNSNYGFLFTGDGPGQDQLFRTTAHELGHGVFKLRHNFDQIKGLEKRTTQNLMDYTTTPETATILRKFQWDEIISPRLIALGWSEEKYAEGGIIDRGIIITGNREWRRSFWNNACLPLLKNSSAGRNLFLKAAELATQNKVELIIGDGAVAPQINPVKPFTTPYFLPFDMIKASEAYSAKDGTGVEGIPSPPEVALAHELFHFIQMVNGQNIEGSHDIWKYDPIKFIVREEPLQWKTYKWVENIIGTDEIGAVYGENTVRSQLSLPLRSYYSGEYIFCVNVSSNRKSFYSKEANFTGQWYYLIKKNDQEIKSLKSFFEDAFNKNQIFDDIEFEIWYNLNFKEKIMSGAHKRGTTLLKTITGDPLTTVILKK
ncbi:MAG: hypothetical protein P1P88_00980 [Bacteroidales bacterium]|nr:hypothetical protein [Bacteroidales bacterium]